MKRIVMTGGGTAGHVTPNIALIEKLKEEYEIKYIGSINGIEKQLIEQIKIPYYGISSGKLRRYFSKENFKDIFKIIKGLQDAKKVLKNIKPDLIFSKGGFVSVPVVLAAKTLKIPIIVHESDISCGLANKISIPFAKHVCCSFPETLNKLPKNKTFLTGTPIREELFNGDKEKAKLLCNFDNNKPVILVMGGSLGSLFLNNALRESLNVLLNDYNIVHLCGKNNLDESLNLKGYKQFEYLSDELKDVLALSDVVISRAGANSISEFLCLKKPNILIPLSKRASRGDQILNAKSFEKSGYSIVIEEEILNKELLIKNINYLFENKNIFIEKMSKSKLNNSVDEVIKVIKKII